MAKTVGYTCAIVSHMILNGRGTKKTSYTASETCKKVARRTIKQSTRKKVAIFRKFMKFGAFFVFTAPSETLTTSR